jgi:hypothetical protein
LWFSKQSTTTTTTSSAAAACTSGTDLLKNSGFETGISPWNFDGGDYGSAALESTYLSPDGGTTAYAITLSNIPANGQASATISQSVPAILDGENYSLYFESYVQGTNSATCSFVYNVGFASIFPSGGETPTPGGPPASPFSWGRITQATVGNVPASAAGETPSFDITFTCTAGAVPVTVIIYLDNIELNDQCVNIN